MNKQILFRVIDPFKLGFLYGRKGCNWSAREVEERVAMRNANDTTLFLNGMQDGLLNDRFRLNKRRI